MLTPEKKQNNTKKFIELLSKLNIDLTEISKYLDEIGYFDAPANNQQFKAYPGGLCEYALDTCFELAQLVNAYCPGRYTEQDVIKVALFKDLYRAVMYEGYMKNTKDEATGTWISVPAYRTKEERPMFGDIGFSSYMIAKRFIGFTDEQTEAIIHSRSTDLYVKDIHNILRAYPLVTLTRMADLAATYLEKY
ncbi:MAG: hypothetical protein J6A25_00580 [Lachnospiraceae bacterium]|nr:hypothetical protein [Lachnospiraceae bacterium]